MSLKRFTISGNAGAASVTAATAGISKLEGTAATRAALYEWDFGTAAAAAPVDQNYLIRLKRYNTSAGTWTAATPTPLDSADAAAVCIGGIASTAVGTAGSVLLTVGVNARAGFRWVAIPDSEFIVPAVATNGIQLEYAAISGGTDINQSTLFYQE